MRKLLLIVAMIASLCLSAAPAAMAQSDVDLDQVSDAVLAADLESLMTGMETPPADEDLPAGFSEATYIDPDSATGQEGVLPAGDLEGAEGSVAYSLTWDPGAAGTPVAGESATPSADAFAVRLATLNYIFIGEEITDQDLEDFKTGAEEGIASDESGEATVEDVEINGVNGIVISYVLEDSGFLSVVKMVALPVGNTMVIGMTVEAAEEVDEDAVLAAAESLTLAGADHLGTVAEESQ